MKIPFLLTYLAAGIAVIVGATIGAAMRDARIKANQQKAIVTAAVLGDRSQAMSHRPIVEVHWRDAEANAGWESLDEKRTAPLVRSVGILIEKTDSHITIALNHSGNEINAWITIPAGMLVRYEVIREGSDAEIEVY